MLQISCVQFYHFHFFVHAVFVSLYFPQCLIRSRMTWKYSPLCKNKFKRQAFSCSGEKSSSSSNILGTNIYSDIHSGQFCLYEYIRTFVRVKFVCTNIFRHSFMSVLESENRPNIRIYSNIRTIFNTNIYSDIRSCQIFYTNIFGHSFV